MTSSVKRKSTNMQAIIALSIGLLTFTLCTTLIFFLLGIYCGSKIMKKKLDSPNTVQARNVVYEEVAPIRASNPIELCQNAAYGEAK